MIHDTTSYAWCKRPTFLADYKTNFEVSKKLRQAPTRQSIIYYQASYYRLWSNFQLSIYLYLRSHKPHILDTVPCFTSPGPQPKSPILQDSMSSYVFAAVNIILAAMWGEVHTCSRLTFGFSKGSISESIDSNCFNFMLPLLQ